MFEGEPIGFLFLITLSMPITEPVELIVTDDEVGDITVTDEEV